jgi:hypothetical protein
MKDQNEPQAMRRYLLKHAVVLVHFESPTEMKDRIDVLDWDKLSMCDQDDLLQLAFVARETGVRESFSPLSIRIPVDLETLPMMLKVGFKLNSDLYHTGHSSTMLHLDRLKDERFSYRFISRGLSCLSIPM